MCEDVSDRFADDVVGHPLRAYAGIDLCGLAETPVVDQLDNVVVYDDRSVDNLARRGIDPRGPHRIGDLCRDEADTRVFQVVRIEFGVVLREIADLHDILEADFFKGLVPAFDAFFGRFAPQGGECVVEVEDDRFHGFYQFAASPSCRIRRLDVPTVDHRVAGDLVGVGVEVGAAGEKDSDTGVGHARTHLLFGEHHDAARHAHRERVVLLQQDQLHQVGRYRVGEHGFDADVVLEGFDFPEGGAAAVERRRDVDAAHRAAFDRRQRLIIRREEVGCIEDHRRRIVVEADDLVRVQDRVHRAELDGVGHLLVRLVEVGQHADLAHVDRAVDQVEPYMHRRLGFVADRSKVGVAGFRDRRCDQHFAAHVLHGQFDVEFALGLVQGHEPAFGPGRHIAFVLHEGLVVLGDLFLCHGVRLFGLGLFPGFGGRHGVCRRLR